MALNIQNRWAYSTGEFCRIGEYCIYYQKWTDLWYSYKISKLDQIAKIIDFNIMRKKKKRACINSQCSLNRGLCFFSKEFSFFLLCFIWKKEVACSPLFASVAKCSPTVPLSPRRMPMCQQLVAWHCHARHKETRAFLLSLPSQENWPQA